jgi:hypothetical protein
MKVSSTNNLGKRSLSKLDILRALTPGKKLTAKRRSHNFKESRICTYIITGLSVPAEHGTHFFLHSLRRKTAEGHQRLDSKSNQYQ